MVYRKKIVESEVGNKKLRELNTEIAGKKFNLDLSNTESSKFEPGASLTSVFKLPPRSQEGGTTALKTFRSMSNLFYSDRSSLNLSQSSRLASTNSSGNSSSTSTAIMPTPRMIP